MSAKPTFTVEVAGLDPQQSRVVEVLFRNIRHNRYVFRVCDGDPGTRRGEVLLAVAADPAGRAALERARAEGRPAACVAVLGPGEQGEDAGQPAIAAADLLRGLLPLLNRTVESTGLADAARLAPTGTEPTGTEPTATEPTATEPTATEPTARAVPDEATAPLPAEASASCPTTPAAAPALAEPAVPTCAEPDAPAAGGPARPRVLVVDGSPATAAELAEAFERLGLELDAVGSAGDALARLAVARVDLAMLELVLPDGCGLQLARAIRAEPRWRDLPIVVLSHRRSALDVIRGAMAGCSAYLAKPVAFDDLSRTVSRQLGRPAPLLQPAPSGVPAARPGLAPAR